MSYAVPYVAPKGKIVEAFQIGEVSSLKIEFDRMDNSVTGPIAPAGLYVDPRSGQERFQHHKVVSQDDLTFHFETYNSHHPIPIVGDIFSYRGWWLAKAMEAALDAAVLWEHRIYPDNGDHNHCLLTWTNIAANAEQKSGWWCEKYGWISESAHEDFILNDIYRLKR